MTLFNQADDYFKGFIVGGLTVFAVGSIIIVIVSIVDALPELYRIIGLLAFVFSIPFWLLRTVKKTERFIRIRFEKANPKFTNPIIPINKEAIEK